MKHETRIDLTQMKTPWPLKVKVKRGIWLLVQAVLFRPTFKNLCRSWRVFLLRLFGAEIGAGCLILPSAKILMPWKLKMGDGAVIGADVDVYNFDTIELGTMAMVSQRSFLCTGSHDYEDPHMPLTFAPIYIGSEAWVSAECFVGPGVTIGNGAVLAARTVAVKDVPEWMICGGNPCREIKPRTVNDHPSDELEARLKAD
jgi:putative colanic acid biosynthesis acetyltransferase WcaF